MLTLVEITNARSDTLQLPMADSSAGYVVRDIEGLDPVTASLTSSSMAQLDGVQPQNAQRGSRNITMKIGLQPDYVTSTVDSLRTNLYNYLLPKANVQVGLYKDGSLFAVTQGQVESFENSMFTDDPEIDISIICPDPDLYAPEFVYLDANSTPDTDVQTISYPGTSPAGLIFTFNINRGFSDFSLYCLNPDNASQIFTAHGGMVLDDIVTITSVPGAKAAQILRGGLESSILSWVDPTSSWPVLENGDNFFRAYVIGAAVPYTIAYLPKYAAF